MSMVCSDIDGFETLLLAEKNELASVGTTKL
jgi:hypothetical protein